MTRDVRSNITVYPLSCPYTDTVNHCLVGFSVGHCNTILYERVQCSEVIFRQKAVKYNEVQCSPTVLQWYSTVQCSSAARCRAAVQCSAEVQCSSAVLTCSAPVQCCNAVLQFSAALQCCSSVLHCSAALQFCRVTWLRELPHRGQGWQSGKTAISCLQHQQFTGFN